jgi:hypothetical protein
MGKSKLILPVTVLIYIVSVIGFFKYGDFLLLGFLSGIVSLFLKKYVDKKHYKFIVIIFFLYILVALFLTHSG